MKNLIIVFLALIIVSAVHTPSNGQEMVKGIVYADTNNNLKKDRGEKLLSDVAVSNGVDVVLTNSKGEYRLPVSGNDIIFVIKPAAYSVPLNENKLPQFFYIHKPEGSPELKYKGSSATGKLPKSVDFALIPSEETEQESFRMLVFGDPQPYTLEEIDFFYRGIVKELEGVEDVAFGLSLGDLVGDNLDLHLPYINAVKNIGVPWYNVLGNHDLNFDVKSDLFSDETFEANFGPANYSFNHGMVHFIILDDVLYPDPRDGRGYWGGFREDQLKFIENDLKYVPKDHLVVLAFHIPLSETEGGDSFRDEDRTALFNLLKDFPHTLSLSAHTHYQRHDFFTAEEGWPQEGKHHHYNVGTTSGDWYSGRLDENGVPISTMRDGTRKGYAFINFDKNKYSIDYKVAGKPNDYQFEIYAPKVVEQNKRTSAPIVANFFIGSKYDSLFFRIDAGNWKPMHHFKAIDPSYMYELMQWDFTDTLFEGRRPSNPVESSHIWFTGIPTKLELGEHTIEVKAKDMFGRTFIQSKTYRVVEKP